MKRRRAQVQEFAIGWISALPLELEAARAMLDEEYENDESTVQYVLGRIAQHNVVLACLPKAQIGTSSAAVVATKMQSVFPALQFGLMVGIGGGVPTSENDVRLGDVVVGTPSGNFGGVVQYDFGKIGQGGAHTRTGFLNAPPTILLTALALLQADRSVNHRITAKSQSSDIPTKFRRHNAGEDKLYLSSYDHEGGSTCDMCSEDMLIQRAQRENEEIIIHYGTIASGNEVMKDAITRDKLSAELGGIFCFEMEAAGLMNSFPCLVVRGICDYADLHKNERWQPFAAIMAAIYAKEILSLVPAISYQNDIGLRNRMQSASDEPALEDGFRSQILHAWRLTDPRDDRRQIENDKNPLMDGSCSWVFNDTAFTSWWEEDDCRILFIHGDPGKGKTMMAMAVIDEILQRLDLCTDSGMLTYFFCQSRSSESNNANAIVRGLTFLLSAQKNCLIRHLQRKYEEAGNKLFEGANSLYTMWSTFMNLLQDSIVDRYYIVIDALDECNDDSMENFLQLLSREIPRLHNVKWIVTTRNEQRIMEYRQYIQNSRDIDLELNSVNVDHAVQSFIDLKVNTLKVKKRYDNELSADIKRYLEEHADGTFLWVSLVCKELEKCFARKAREVCGRFPKGLVPLYQQMLERIEQNDDAEELKQLLRILTIACRSLHLSELGTIANLPDLLNKGQNWQNARDLIASCGSFLMVQEQKVEFIHKSAKDYFSEGAGSRIFPIGQPYVHNALSSYLFRLMSESLRRDICNLGKEDATMEQIDKNTLYRCLPLYLQYACCFWEEHVRKGQKQLEDNGDVHVFLQKKFLYWLEALSLIDRVNDAILILTDLRKLLKPSNSEGSISLLLGMVEDGWRFVRSFRSAIEEAPLQIYHSGLLFAPEQSIIRRTFRKELPYSINMMSSLVQNWSPCLQILNTYDNKAVNALAISSDGGKLASASYLLSLRIVQLWDTTTGLLLLTLKLTSKPTLGSMLKNNCAMAFSPNGSQLLSAFGDGILYIWDTVTGEMLYSYCYSTIGAVPVILSNDSLLLAFGSQDQIVRIWDTSKAVQRHALKDHNSFICGIAFSHDQSLLVFDSYGSIRIWDVTTGAQLHEFDVPANDMKSVAFSSNDIHVASSFNRVDIWIWRVSDGALCKVLKGHIHRVLAISFSPDGSLLASGSESGSLQIWDVTTGVCLHTLEDHTSDIHSVIFTPDGSQLISAGQDATVRIWDVSKRAPSRTPIQYKERVREIAFSPDGSWLASTGYGKVVDIWDVSTGRLLQSLKSHQAYISTLAISFDGLRLALGLWYGTIHIWETTNWSTSFVLRGHDTDVMKVACSPQESRLASGAKGDDIKIWNLEDGTCLQIFDHIDHIMAMVFSPNGSALAVGSRGGTQIWDLATNTSQKMGYDRNYDLVEAVAFSPDGLQLASKSYSRNIRVYSSITGALLQEFKDNDIPDLASLSNLWHFSSTLPPAPHLPFTLSVSNGWVAVRGRNILRLPQTYDHSRGAVKDNTIAIGNDRGHVLILKFDL